MDANNQQLERLSPDLRYLEEEIMDADQPVPDKLKMSSILSFKEQKFAQMIAAGIHSPEDIKALLQLTQEEYSSLKKKKKIVNEVEELTAEFTRESMGWGIARKDIRIATLNERHAKLSKVMAERASVADPSSERYDDEFGNIPGMSTGLVVAQRKAIGAGLNTMFVIEHKVDTELLHALNALELQAAKEMGQLREFKDIQISGKAYVGINIEDV